ncbi:MAG: FAD-dependent oxidoreductase [Patescibacteria group bacterium]|nr:FAD-dependent oxidoreductase [Patescibacteria group bacterium]
MQITFNHFEDNTPSCRTFYFTPEQPFAYTAGQFIELTLPHDNPDKRGIKRWFTLSSSPPQARLSITTKFAANGGSSFKAALQELKPGTQLTMSSPMGDFVLPKMIQTPLVFVAGGIGITPFLSMFKWLKDTGEQRPIRFLQAVSNEDEIGFQDVLDGARQHATIVVSQPSAAWGGERGHLSADLILGLEPPTKDSLFYISGPETLVETLATDLAAAGLDKHQIVGDYFPNYPAD